MRGLLHAEWLRLRKRPDLWIVLVAIPVIATVGFVSGFINDSRNVGLGPGQAPPTEFLEFQARLRQQYSFPQSMLTMLDNGWVLFASVFLGSSTVGSEFAFGTIRTSLLASSDRRGFLAARAISLVGLAIVMVASLLVLGVALPLILVELGNDMPVAPSIQPLGLGADIGARILAAMAFMGAGALLAVITRNGAYPLLIAAVYVVLEGLVANLAIWRASDVLGLVPRFLIGQSTGGLIRAAHQAGGAVVAMSEPPGTLVTPAVMNLVIVVAWIALMWGTAYMLLHRADIRE